MACFCARPGTVANTWVARRSQVPIAVPPLGSKSPMAYFAAARVCASIRTIPSSPSAGNASRASWLPATTANHTPSSTWSRAAAAACWTARILSWPIDPEVSTMTISPASPEPELPASPAPAQVTVTIAWTSLPPSGRNSFW